MNYRQIKAIELKNRQRILAVNPKVPDTSGIYILYREENGFISFSAVSSGHISLI